MKHYSGIIIVLILFSIIWGLYNKINITEQKQNNTFSSRYTLFDFTYTTKYFDYINKCWTDTDEIREHFYNIEGHFETPLYNRRKGIFIEGHNHFPENNERCYELKSN